ncbi:MAG: DoxX family membrane protein [Bacteroidota bacterium]
MLPFLSQFDVLDARIAQFMQRYGVVALRWTVGIVFIWFGALKLFPGMSPAEELVKNTVYFFDPGWFFPVLGVWEVLIGLFLIVRPFIRVAIFLLALQMPGTFLPLVLLPEVCFTAFPFGLTLEGQYIVKNLVIIAAALVVGGTVRRRPTAEQRL